MTVDQVAAFDVCGELPEGTTVLEASAGTGKTFTIAALATRYVAEGVAELSQLMLVTFSRAATQELRERVRERLVSAERGLADQAQALAGTDELLRLLAAVPDEEVRARRRRLTRALAGFDEATIATTHGFCQQMLAGLGMAGDTEPDATFLEQIDDLVIEVVDDLYIREHFRSPTAPEINYTFAKKVARDAMADRQAELVPADADPGSAAEQRYGIGCAVRREVETRKRARRLLDYDDLLTRLRDALIDPVRGPAARERIRSRYRVVLVDEFQDTDPVQWQILRTTFHGTTTLVVIGDPKQAIYAFRGADLVTYLEAAGAAGTQRTLPRNWRSDEDLVTALGSVFGGAALGDPRIVVRPVVAEHVGRRLHGAGVPFRLRVATRAQAGKPAGGVPTVGVARPLVALDLAGDIVSLLRGPGTLTLDGTSRPVRPGDIAALVRTNDQAVLVRDALADVRVPAVINGNKSVFLTRPAREWLTLLRAIEQPNRAGLVTAAALTCFLGWTATRMAASGDAVLDDLGPRLRAWRDVLAGRGVAALLEVITSSGSLFERLLATPNGERDLTDVRHIGEELHAAAIDGQLGPAALVTWLQRRITEARREVAEEGIRRLESDAEAVQVVTIHSSKGLEFPIVYVPFGWDRHVPNAPDPLRLHADDGTRLLDIGGKDGPAHTQHRAQHEAEECGEDLRLLYVAMTRAKCQLVAWWVPSRNTPAAPLHRLLFADYAPGNQPPEEVDVPPDVEVRRRLDARLATARGTIAIEPLGGGAAGAWTGTAEPAGVLTAATFDRRLDGAWQRLSYSGLTAVLHDPTVPPGVGSEPEIEVRADEPELPPAPPTSDQETGEEQLRAAGSPMADLPAGTAFGTLVHSVLETVDPTAADLAGELRARCEQAVGRRFGSGVDAGALADGLLPVLSTPLGPLAGNQRLRDITPANRLAELDFELPLAGGDEPRAVDATLAALAELLRRYLPATDLLAGYPDALDVPALRQQRLRGYLAGSIDAVLRVHDESGSARYLIADYKTNWLGGFGLGAEPLTAWHYRPAAITTEMIRAQYPLQALLYSVAVHRFLRWRQPAYDPDKHLGGVLYLFVRGMCGPSTPVVGGVPCGVFSWLPPAGLVEDVSALLDRGSA
jgi:exodeoxyribonuclease V beta subunit